MTKEEIYSELERLGTKPAKACRFCNVDELKAALEALGSGNNGDDQNKGKESNAGEGNEGGNTDTGSGQQSGEGNQEQNGDNNEQTETIPVLHFDHSGWCDELKCSYRRGIYNPKDRAEFEALSKYAIAAK